ncbi:hypothetical protein [Streptomyces halobius]|uniref:Uncharacterized protein n=1 Tax=Streptomyces halobius TaxID=2879846 RepID=A0ABY4M4K7_9ACTN|nr:hypothetical protein [Streptomyces halobius]UQA91321.1 hypothetical protein K9S39_04995 [Streptomyces halobius]
MPKITNKIKWSVKSPPNRAKYRLTGCSQVNKPALGGTMSLASVDDVAARLGRTIPEEERPRVEAFLADATAFVADYCGSGFREDSPGIKAVICAEVIRWLSVQPGVVRERTGELEVEFGSASAAQQLSPAARASLKRYRPALRSLSLVREVNAQLR